MVIRNKKPGRAARRPAFTVAAEGTIVPQRIWSRQVSHLPYASTRYVTLDGSMKIGVAQIDCQVGDVEANCRIMASAIEEAAAAKCDSIVLPEMADTGYDIEVIKAKASTWDAGPCGTLRELAAKNGVRAHLVISESLFQALHRPAQPVYAPGPILVVLHDPPPLVPPRHYVVHRTRKLDS